MIPLLSGIVFDGGSDFDGPKAWEADLSGDFTFLGMNGPNKASFSTVPLPSGIAFHGGSNFDAPKAWEADLSNDFTVWGMNGPNKA